MTPVRTVRLEETATCHVLPAIRLCSGYKLWRYPEEKLSLVKMLKLLCVVAVLFCCGLVSGHHLHAPRCLPIFGKYPFDEQKFSGDWYSVANVFRPELHSEELKCDKIHFTAETVENVTKTHFDITFKTADGTEHHVEGRGQAFKPGLASVSSVAFRFPEDDKWHNVVKHSILATDYETYAIVHGCGERYDEKIDTFIKHDINQIWSRSKTLDEGVLKTLKSVMSGFDIVEDDWAFVDNSDC
ncbi:apolipoprotein D-like [Cryptotermes secundus]|uniref:apolipoprotein D-like n=1 Tax=Cryptotermes secundus TaxID=105785 RepID=UPI000CD7AD01|nr:apolipoprotein D-like [Cryptotermes secundus]